MDHSTTHLDDLRTNLLASRRSAWVRAVVGPAGNDPPRVLALLAVVGPRPPGWEDRTWTYDQCTFVAGRVTTRQFASWWKGGKQNLTIGSVRAALKVPENHQFTCVHLASLAEYGKVALPWPSFMYTPQTLGVHTNPPQEYLVGAGDVPSFPAFSTAFNAFFYDNYVVTGAGNPELGRATIYSIDGRARIRRVRVHPTSLDVWLGGSRLRDTLLELNSTDYRTVVGVDKQHVVLPLPNGLPSDPWLWLKTGSEWLDFRPLSYWGGRLSPDIEVELPSDPAAELSRLAAQGEGAHLEYKEKLPHTKDEKRTVLKTVVAFANGDGGTMLFGVDDAGEITGLSGSSAVERRRLSDLPRDLVSPSPRVRIETQRLDNRDVLVLHVEPGRGTIHALVLDSNKPEYYVRRDGTTYYARPDDLAAIAGQTSSSAATILPGLP